MNRYDLFMLVGDKPGRRTRVKVFARVGRVYGLDALMVAEQDMPNLYHSARTVHRRRRA